MIISREKDCCLSTNDEDDDRYKEKQKQRKPCSSTANSFSQNAFDQNKSW